MNEVVKLILQELSMKVLFMLVTTVTIRQHNRVVLRFINNLYMKV